MEGNREGGVTFNSTDAITRKNTGEGAEKETEEVAGEGSLNPSFGGLEHTDLFSILFSLFIYFLVFLNICFRIKS